MKCGTKKTLLWCRSLYISMKLGNNAIHSCIFVTYGSSLLEPRTYVRTHGQNWL